MKSIVIATIIVLFAVLVCQAFSGIQPPAIYSSGTIRVDESNYVTPFGFRIADMMADLLSPNFDDYSVASQWQAALNDLVTASPNHEITHVQMRIWWDLQDGFIVPRLWSTDNEGSQWGGQWVIMNNETWKRWYFGAGSLRYGPSAAQRIHNAGLKMELSISGAWENGDVVKPGGSIAPVGSWGAKEADYPAWIAAGGGDTFLENYKNNVLIPAANFAKDYLQDGDIFNLSFEMSYPTSDFTWSHNAKWNSTIDAVRDVFRAAGKRIVLTLDHCGWFDDFSLGYDAVKLLNPSAPIGPGNKGISGAKYLGNLDFISFSNWLPLILQSEMKTTWADTDVTWLVDHWFSNPNFDQVGTGYSSVPRVAGRDIIADCRALAQVMGRLVLQNTGWESRHGFLYTSPRRGSGTTPDSMEQRVAWASQLAAIGDSRANYTAWCAGQDFERYCRDKADDPNSLDTSWRGAPAQTAIIDGIKDVLAH